MNSKKSLLIVAAIAIFALSSCSGLGDVCTTNCGGGGDALVSITMSDTPPTNASVVSFTLPVIGIALVPSSGSQVQVFSSGNFELTRLQSDTSLVATNVKLAAGTYSGVNVTVSSPTGVYYNGTTGTLGSCVAGSYCTLTGSATTISYTFPSAITLSANTNQWINLDFNYNNAVVVNNTALAIDMTQTAVMTASSTVPVGVASGNFANIDDFTGQVTAVSSSSITVTSKMRGSLTAAINSNTTQFFDPLSQCTSTVVSSCVGIGSVVSVQALLSTSGTVNASSVDLIDSNTSPSDEVEGTIFPSLCNGVGSFGMVLSDSVINTSGSPLTGVGFGQGVCLTLSQGVVFGVDTGILTPALPAGGTNFPGFSNFSDLIGGQTVRAVISGATTGSNGFINANTTGVLLRFSRLTGTVDTTAGNVFTLTGLPTYLGTTFTVSPQVLTNINYTLLENVPSSSVSNLTGTVSMSALYLNVSGGAQYWFQAAKVRQK
jgi:hypothetical protein